MFKCDKCGICCKNLKNSNLYKYLDNGGGICKYLDENNLCKIYNNRPLICNIDESYEKFFKNNISIEEYYELNYKGCQNLKNNFIKK